MLLGQPVHARAGGEVVGRLGAAVQHDQERQGSAAMVAGDIEPVAPGPGCVAVGAGEEPRTLGQGLGCRPWLEQPAQIRPGTGLAQTVEEAAERFGQMGMGRPFGRRGVRHLDRVGGEIDGPLRPVRGWVGNRRAAQGALDELHGLGEPAGAGEARGLDHVGMQGVGHGIGFLSAAGRAKEGGEAHGQRIRSARAAFTAGLACRAPRTVTLAMAARASSGVTSVAMLARPRTWMSSISPLARDPSRSARL